MTAETAMAILELLLVFGGVLALGGWELYSLRRDRRRVEREARSNSSEPDGHE